MLICLVGGSAFDVTRIGARDWVISLALGFVSLPLGALIRLIPNEPCERVFKKLQLIPTYELHFTTRLDAEPGFSLAIDHLRDNLTTFASLRGDRRSYARKAINADETCVPSSRRRALFVSVVVSC